MSLDLPLSDTLLPAAPSAARRDAEAAFAAPARPAAVSTAQVTVRRRRIGPADRNAPPTDTATPVDEAPRGPRVFRVEAPLVPTAPVITEGLVATALPAPRRRRRSPDQRPSPVVVVVPPAEPLPEGALDPRLNRLGEALAPVGPVLDEIARAQSFRFDGDGQAGDWQALSRRVEALLQALRRRPR